MLHQFAKPLPSLRRLLFHYGVQCWHLSVLRRLPLGPFSGAHRGRGPPHRRKSFSVGGRHGAKVAERVKEVSLVPRHRGGVAARHRGCGPKFPHEALPLTRSNLRARPGRSECPPSRSKTGGEGHNTTPARLSSVRAGCRANHMIPYQKLGAQKPKKTA